MPKVNQFLLLLLALPLFAKAAVLPPERVTLFAPGVPGGIPLIEFPKVNVTDFGAKNDSSADASGAIQAALDSLAATGGVVYIPAGRYRLDKQLTFNGNRTVLRGAGAESTRLYSGCADHSIFIGMYGRGAWQGFTNAKKGSQQVTVTDGTLFTPGEFAELQQANDSALMYTDPAWNVDWAECMVGQLFEVASVKGSTVTFTTPLHYGVRSDLAPQIRPQKFRTFTGVEDLYLEKTAPEGHTIHIKNAAYCWVSRVESNFTRKAHIETATALGCTFSHNYLHHSFGYGDGGSGYGTSLHTHTTNCLVEDNVFYHLRHAMIIQNGATGNVVAYNFSTSPVQGESDAAPLNDGWDPPDISFHGHYAQYNLAEGNIVTEIGISDYWGPMGPGNTFFRNDVRGTDGIILSDHSHGQNIVGNLCARLTDDSTSKNTWLDGNRIGGAAVSWRSDSSRTLEASLWLAQKPSYWTDDIVWPGTGSDCLAAGSNPAEVRWRQKEYITQNGARREYSYEKSSVALHPFDIILAGAYVQIVTSQHAAIRLFDLRGCVLWSAIAKHGTVNVPRPVVRGAALAVVNFGSGSRLTKKIVVP